MDHESWWARAVLINTLLFIFVLFLTTPTVVLSTLHELEASIGKQPFFILYFHLNVLLNSFHLWSHSRVLLKNFKSLFYM